MFRRYLLRELLPPLIASTVLLSTLFYVMAFLRGSEFLLGSAVTVVDLLRFSLSLLPSFIVQTLPISVLLSVLLGFGRLSEDGEVTAMFAVGMAPRTFLRAPLVLGLALSALMVLLTFTLKPWGIELLKATAQDIIRRNIVGDLKPGTFQEEIQGFTFYAERVEPGQRWKNVLLFDGRDPDSPLLAVAPECHVSAEVRADLLSFALERGAIHRATASSDEYTLVGFERALFQADIGEALFRKNSFRFGYDEYSPLELLRQAMRARAAGESDRPFLAAFHWRLAQIFTPLVFALVAVPLALGRRAAGKSWSYVQAVGVYASYFVVARLLAQVSEKGTLPPWVAGQVPLLACLALAIGLLWRLERKGAA